MNVVQQLPQPQHLNIMDLSIFPGSLNLNKVSKGDLTLETIASKLTYFQEQIHLLHWQIKAYGEKNSFHDVCNLSDSLSGEAAKVKYLLTLS